MVNDDGDDNPSKNNNDDNNNNRKGRLVSYWLFFQELIYRNRTVWVSFMPVRLERWDRKELLLLQTENPKKIWKKNPV